MKWVVKEPKRSLKHDIYEKLSGRLSLNAVRKALDSGLCSVNGKQERYGSRRLHPGDEIKFVQKEETKPTLFDPKRTLFEDDYLLIWNKPRGVICNDPAFLESTPSLLLVHRLDRDTSGCLIFAKSEDVRVKMVDLFAKFEVKKRYLAEVWGRVKKDEGTIQTRYGISHKEGTAKRYCTRGKQMAKTQYEVVERKKESTVVHLYPITGRTHQLRVHMESIGHPILGDILYGRREKDSQIPLRLKAEQISFSHPITGESILTSVTPW